MVFCIFSDALERIETRGLKVGRCIFKQTVIYLDILVSTLRWITSTANTSFWRFVKARFKRRATAVQISIDRIQLDFSTAVARRLKPSRATAVLNSIHEL